MRAREFLGEALLGDGEVEREEVERRFEGGEIGNGRRFERGEVEKRGGLREEVGSNSGLLHPPPLRTGLGPPRLAARSPGSRRGLPPMRQEVPKWIPMGGNLST